MSSRRITVIGLGYLGSVTAVHLADAGYRVTGIDTDEAVRDAGDWLRRYNDIAAELADAHLDLIDTSTDYDDITGDVSIVGVNTPAGERAADLSNIKDALRRLARRIDPGHTIILRSTLPPGACVDELIPLVESESGLRYGEDLHFCYAPEFMRGGAGLEDIREPSKTVISGDETGMAVFREVFPVSDNVHETSIATAEAVKCFDNVFHGLKISFANESGRLGRELGFDPVTVMDVITSDEKLNISDMYLSPGHAYGGPCLSKDITILQRAAASAGVETPILSAVNESNSQHAAWVVDMVASRAPDTVGLVGATYKEGFNSLANSPCLDVAARLESRGHDVLIHDPHVEVDGFPQADMATLADETELWVVFNAVDSLDRLREDYDGDVIDLSAFSFRSGISG